eukprot:12422239-Karenia_brevis.AAC.2
MVVWPLEGNTICPECRFPGQRRNCGSALAESKDETKHTVLQPFSKAIGGTDFSVWPIGKALISQYGQLRRH